MTRYHPVLVALHWLMAALIILALIFGKVVLDGLDNADPQKVEGLAGHMTVGLSLGALLALRLVIRLVSAQPPPASTGDARLDFLGQATHWALYALVAAMAVSGVAMALQDDLFAIVFGGSGAKLPAEFASAPRAAHGAVSTALLALAILHIAAALYHQFILRDGLFRRMWFGSRR